MHLFVSGSFTLVHGYHGSFSLRHWLQQSDWLPTLQATLALDAESGSSGRRYSWWTCRFSTVATNSDFVVWSELLAQPWTCHTELRLENLHISLVDKHIRWT